MNAVVRLDEFRHLTDSAIATEQSVIGICMMEPQAFTAAQGWLAPHHFIEPAHEAIWSAMETLGEAGRPVTPITVITKLGNQKIGDINLQTYIARCAAETSCPAAYVVDYARQVREGWCLREIAESLTMGRAEALAPGCDARNLIAAVMQQLDETRAVIEGRVVGSRSAGSVAAALLAHVAGIRSGAVKDPFIPTGLRDLDRKLNGGFRPGELIVIAGRPGMGKTLAAASIARQAARAGHAGGFFSLEMPEHQISARFLADEAYSGHNSITASEIIGGQVDDARALHLGNAAAAMVKYPLAIDCPATMTVGEIGARTRTLAKRYERQGLRLEFIAIDYLKFLKASDRYRGQRVLEVGEITGGLKALAKDLGIAVVLLAQLNRQNEQSADKKPDLSHLRDSGEIEQDADVVLLLYREAYYLAKDGANDPEKAARLIKVANQLDIIIGKNRMGQTGPVTVYCHPGAAAVRDLMGGY
jgi:replicative DNA helicase